MNSVYFVNRFYWPDRSATAQILTDLTQHLDLPKHTINVITSRNLYEGDSGQLQSSESIGDIQVHRAWSTNFGRAKLLCRMVDYLSFYLGALILLLRLVRPGDIIVAKTDPPIISFFAYLVSKIKKASLVNWIQDLFPEVAGALGVIKTDSVIYWTLKKLKEKSIKGAALNVVIGERMRDLLKQSGVAPDKIAVIHNWNINPLGEYVPKAQNPLAKQWGLVDKFVIGYSGNFGRAHEYQIIQDTINALKRDENTVFLFIGSGKYYEDLKRYVQENEISNVIFKPYLPIENLDESLSVPDVHLISLNPKLEGLIVPSKFYGLASIGAPIIFIGAENGEISRILQKYDCGIVVNPETPEQLAKELIEIRNNPSIMKIQQQNLRKCFDSLYDKSIAYKKWTELIKLV